MAGGNPVPDAGLRDGLSPERRLALAYAPAGAREAVLAVLALDARLGGIVLRAREPLLAQVRLAWWRDRLAEPAEIWPSGEPLLAVLRHWPGDRAALGALVDGWEGLLADAPPAEGVLLVLAAALGGAFAELGGADAARTMGTDWALAELARIHPDPAARDEALRLARARNWKPGRLPRGLRSLAVLHAMARSSLRRLANGDKVSVLSLFAGIRAGITGL